MTRISQGWSSTIAATDITTTPAATRRADTSFTGFGNVNSSDDNDDMHGTNAEASQAIPARDHATVSDNRRKLVAGPSPPASSPSPHPPATRPCNRERQPAQARGRPIA